MTAVRFHSEAEAEMIHAAVWYEQQQRDLGGRFLASVQDGITRIQINPRLFPVVEENSRKNLPLQHHFRGQAGRFDYHGRHAPPQRPRLLETPQMMALLPLSALCPQTPDPRGVERSDVVNG
jgi:hypothetical protein